MNKALEEIKAVFDKYNVDIQLTYTLQNGEKDWEMDLTFEGSDGCTYYLGYFWQGRIKAYNLDASRCIKE